MTEESVVKIEIEKEVPFEGPGDSLVNRLKNVSLRGFPDVKIYQHSRFSLDTLKPDEIRQRLTIPQPNVYRPKLERVNKLASLFKEKGIDIFNLDRAYDYIATDASGQRTNWTMLPPIVERFSIPRHAKGGFNYQDLVGPVLSEALREAGLAINDEVETLPYCSENDQFELVNDGMHRVYAGFEKSGVAILVAENITPGYPYYAAPQSWDKIILHDNMIEDTSGETKVHVVTNPGHKNLYRLFPSGGIHSGDVRPAVEGEEFT